MYYIASLAKFGNCYSMISAVGKANERARTLVFPFQRRQQKRYTLFYNVFSDMILYISAYYKHFGYQKLSQHQYVLLLWWSGTVATVLRSLKSVVRKYVSPRIFFCLYHPDLHLISPISSLDQCTFIILEPVCAICPARVLSEDDSWFSWQVLNSSKQPCTLELMHTYMGEQEWAREKPGNQARPPSKEESCWTPLQAKPLKSLAGLQ